MSLRLFFITALTCLVQIASFAQKTEPFKQEHKEKAEVGSISSLFEYNMCVIILGIAILLVCFWGFILYKECTLVKKTNDNPLKQNAYDN